jgi:hypothetical protein
MYIPFRLLLFEFLEGKVYACEGGILLRGRNSELK